MRTKRHFSKAADAIRAYFNGNLEAYSSNIKPNRYQELAGLKVIANTAICSYGSHYPLAWQVHCPVNGLVWLINTRGYSNTTAKHINEALWRAKQSGLPTVRVELDKWRDFQANDTMPEIMHSVSKSTRARSESMRNYHMGIAITLWYEANKLACLQNGIKFPTYDQKYIAKTEAKLLKLQASHELKKKKEEATKVAERVKQAMQANRPARIKGPLQSYQVPGVEGHAYSVKGKRAELIPGYGFYQLIHFSADKLRVNVADFETGLGIASAKTERKAIIYAIAQIKDSKEKYTNAVKDKRVLNESEGK